MVEGWVSTDTSNSIDFEFSWKANQNASGGTEIGNLQRGEKKLVNSSGKVVCLVGRAGKYIRLIDKKS